MINKIDGNKKLTYSIGQVAAHVNLPQSVLRYWETVFPLFSPAKSAGGSRQYSNADVKIILRIKDLLYENGFTIKGANLQLDKDKLSSVSETPEQSLNVGNMQDKDDTAMHSPEDLILKLKELIHVLED